MVVCFISTWTIQQSLVHLEFLMKSMSGEEVAHLISVLFVTLSGVTGVSETLVNTASEHCCYLCALSPSLSCTPIHWTEGALVICSILSGKDLKLLL